MTSSPTSGTKPARSCLKDSVQSVREHSKEGWWLSRRLGSSRGTMETGVAGWIENRNWPKVPNELLEEKS